MVPGLAARVAQRNRGPRAFYQVGTRRGRKRRRLVRRRTRGSCGDHRAGAGVRLCDNPEINSARAQTRADDENVPIARAARLPVDQHLQHRRPGETSDIAGISGTEDDFDNQVGAEVDAEPLHRLPRHELHPPVGGRRAGEPRAPAQHRAERPFRRGAGLHGRDPRHRHPRHPPQQRPLPRRAGARRERALQRRREHPHRRGAGARRGWPRRAPK